MVKTTLPEIKVELQRSDRLEQKTGIFLYPFTQKEIGSIVMKMFCQKATKYKKDM